MSNYLLLYWRIYHLNECTQGGCSLRYNLRTTFPYKLLWNNISRLIVESEQRGKWLIFLYFYQIGSPHSFIAIQSYPRTFELRLVDNTSKTFLTHRFLSSKHLVPNSGITGERHLFPALLCTFVFREISNNERHHRPLPANYIEHFNSIARYFVCICMLHACRRSIIIQLSVKSEHLISRRNFL